MQIKKLPKTFTDKAMSNDLTSLVDAIFLFLLDLKKSQLGRS